MTIYSYKITWRALPWEIKKSHIQKKEKKTKVFISAEKFESIDQNF